MPAAPLITTGSAAHAADPCPKAPTRCSGRLFPGNQTGRALAACVTTRDACVLMIVWVMQMSWTNCQRHGDTASGVTAGSCVSRRCCRCRCASTCFVPEPAPVRDQPRAWRQAPGPGLPTCWTAERTPWLLQLLDRARRSAGVVKAQGHRPGQRARALHPQDLKKKIKGFRESRIAKSKPARWEQRACTCFPLTVCRSIKHSQKSPPLSAMASALLASQLTGTALVAKTRAARPQASDFD
jgi:hypothetical protein